MTLMIRKRNLKAHVNYKSLEIPARTKSAALSCIGINKLKLKLINARINESARYSSA